jgi:hypothetical protein
LFKSVCYTESNSQSSENGSGDNPCSEGDESGRPDECLAKDTVKLHVSEGITKSPTEPGNSYDEDLLDSHQQMEDASSHPLEGPWPQRPSTPSEYGSALHDFLNPVQPTLEPTIPKDYAESEWCVDARDFSRKMSERDNVGGSASETSTVPVPTGVSANNNRNGHGNLLHRENLTFSNGKRTERDKGSPKKRRDRRPIPQRTVKLDSPALAAYRRRDAPSGRCSAVTGS